MQKHQRILTTALWAVLVAVMLGVIGTGLWRGARDTAADDRTLETYYPAPAFSLTNQDGKTLSDKDLRGHVWVCDFIFTHCAGVCKTMAERMTALQKQVGDADVRFVSFSVDPEHDTPQRLLEYRTELGGDVRWQLLTGTKQAMFDVAKGMHVAAKPADAENPIFHDSHFLLIDAAGQMRGSYAGDDPAAVKQLAADITRLTAEAKANPAEGTRGGDVAAASSGGNAR